MSEFVKAAVIGHPISHAKSPLIHNYWIKKYGLEGSYEAIDIPCESLEQGVQGLVQKGFSGFNITVPHKEAIIPLCDEIDDLATAVGAVNTVVIDNGKLKGTNTDVYGFIQNIKETQPDFDFKSGQAVVLGAGGAARAVLYGLLQEGVPEVLIVNRTKAKAEKLLGDLNAPAHVKILDWDERSDALKEAHLLVNTTSLGMQGAGPLEVDLENLAQQALVHDIVYAPLYTDLLKAAETRGNPIITGIGMLLHQARPAFEAWFGVLPEVDEELEKLVLS